MLFQPNERKSVLDTTGWVGKDRFILKREAKMWLSFGKAGPSTARTNGFSKKTKLCLCWDQSGIENYEHKLSKP